MTQTNVEIKEFVSVDNSCGGGAVEAGFLFPADLEFGFELKTSVYLYLWD